MKLGDQLPSLEFHATNGLIKNLKDYKDQWLVLYFYPKDGTPGCTMEGRQFRNHYSEFQALNTEIFGVSRDTQESHERFKCKQNFPFELISDTDETLCQWFDVITTKSFFGKQLRGIQRSTFLIAPDGILAHEW